MSYQFLKTTAALVLAIILPISALADSTTQQAKTKITEQLRSYEQALNASDTASVLKLYSEDGIFIPEYSQPVVGREAVGAVYTQIFKTIKLNVRFKIDEIQPLSRDWAFARTQSSGTVKVLGTDKPESAEGNNEIFILHRESDGQWRIARYLFASNKAPHAE